MSAEQYFKLPCGYLTKDGELYTHIKVREMSGEEEDKLTDKRNRKGNKWLEELMCAVCMLTTDPTDQHTMLSIPITKEICTDMTLGDRFTCLIRIRQTTYGQTYKFEFTCASESCGEKNIYALDLNSLELDVMDNPRQREYTFTLPRKKEEVTFRVATGVEETMGAKYLKQYPGADSTCDLACRLVSVNGQTVMNSVKYLQALSIIDRQAYRDAINAAEGTIQVILKDVECKACSGKVDMAIPTQQSFFSPASEK